MALALIAAGAFWIMGLGLVGAAYQGQLPDWVKARGVSYYLVAFQGAAGIGSLCMGAIAQATSVSTAFLIVAGGLTAATIGTWRVALPEPAAIDHLLTEPLPLPELDQAVEDGPVLVTVEYALAPGASDQFLGLTGELRRVRRRTGATRWHLHRDLDDADLFIETSLVGSWLEHERQHALLERHDQTLLEQIDTLLRAGRPRTAHHAIGIRPGRTTS